MSRHPDVLAVSCGPCSQSNWSHWAIHLAEQPEKSIQSYSLLCDEDFSVPTS
ncbi:MAG: hypothetical protein ACLU4J_11870 [Butyricimonas paravirosa]